MQERFQLECDTPGELRKLGNFFLQLVNPIWREKTVFMSLDIIRWFAMNDNSFGDLASGTHILEDIKNVVHCTVEKDYA